MQDLHQILIPIVAITSVFSIPIIAIVYHFRQKNREMDERALMIEKGIMPPPLERIKKRNSRSKTMENGLNLLAVGLGLLIGYTLQNVFDMHKIFAIGGSILFFLGIANVLMVVLEPKTRDENE
jgi:fucose permease|tara:strand:- start:72 stop:443 length:372 start_codon:yes stop_codon:yes gene_type:complete